MLLNSINGTFSYNLNPQTNQPIINRINYKSNDQSALKGFETLSRFEIEDEVKLLKMVKLPSDQKPSAIKNYNKQFNDIFTSSINNHSTDRNKELDSNYNRIPSYQTYNTDKKLYSDKFKINRQQFSDSIINLTNLLTLTAQSTSSPLSLLISTLFKSNFTASSQTQFDTRTSDNLESSNSFQSPIALPIASKQFTDLLNSTKLPIKSIVLNKNETIPSLMNSTGTNNNVVYQYPPYIRNTATFIFIIILIFGTIGNILVSVIIIKSKDLRNTTNYFLINLSIADLLVIIVCMPTVLIELHSKPEIWLLGEFMCKTIPFVEMSVAHASILTMLAISFERFYAICKPLKVSYKCTKLRAVLIILAVWIIALISTLPLLFIAKQSSAIYLDGTEVEVCLTQANDNWSKAYFLIIITLFFFLPLCVLVIIYVAITKRLCVKENISYTESVQMRARRQVVIMLATVICCFFICLLPFRLFTLFLLFINAQTLDSIGMETYYVYLYTSRVMLYLNSALNPLLYNLISSKFRNAFMQTLCCRNLSSTNRMLIRQSTFNTTTTTMSLTNNSVFNGFLNHFSSSNFSDLNNLNKCKKSSIQTCSLKQSHSIDTNLTNLRQLNFKRTGRQSSLQQISSTSGLVNKDENDNKITNELINNKNELGKKDKANKRLIKQAKFVQNEIDEINQIDEQINEANEKSNDKSEKSNKLRANKLEFITNKKNYTVNCELKVATLEEDLNSINSSFKLDGKKRCKFSLRQFKFYQNIANCVNKSNLIRLNDRTNTTTLKETINDEDKLSQKESNV